jgi:hypothetical protein
MMTNFGKKLGNVPKSENGDRKKSGVSVGQSVYVDLFRTMVQSRTTIV